MRERLLEMLAGREGEFISGEEASRRLGISRTAVWKHIRKLEEEGYTIEACRNRGYRLAGAPDPSPFRLSSLTERRDYVDVRDAVRAYGVLLERGEPGRVYPIATGRQRTLGEVAAAYERAAGFRVEWLIGDSDEPSPPPADPSALLALGWRPEIPFARSVADTLDDNAGSVAWFMRTQRSGDG